MATASFEPRSSDIDDNTEMGLAYAPRRSNRVSEDICEADGETWTERIAVCEGVTETGAPLLLLRSYYRNSAGTRKWDEPPSGASKIRHASAEHRRRAELQMQELQLTLDMIPPDTEGGAVEQGNEVVVNKKKRFFGIFGNKKKEKKQVDESQDLNLQRAIARSMADVRGTGTVDDPVIFFDSECLSPTRAGSVAADYDDDEIAIAKALSISEAEVATSSPAPQFQLTEEEMIQRAIEESRHEAESPLKTEEFASIPPASMPPASTFFEDFSPPNSPAAANKSQPDEFWDQKMPAEQKDSFAAKVFDPYAPKIPNIPNIDQVHPPLSSLQPNDHLDQQQPVDLVDETLLIKLEDDGGQNKSGRGKARRMFGNKKGLQDKAGVV